MGILESEQVKNANGWLFFAAVCLICTVACLFVGYGLASYPSLPFVSAVCIEIFALFPIIVSLSISILYLAMMKTDCLMYCFDTCKMIIFVLIIVLCAVSGSLVTRFSGAYIRVYNGVHFYDANTYVSAENFDGYNLYHFVSGTIVNPAFGYKLMFVKSHQYGQTTKTTTTTYYCVAPVISSSYSGDFITFWAVSSGKTCNIPSCTSSKCIGVKSYVASSVSQYNQAINSALSMQPSLHNAASNIFVEITDDVQKLTEAYFRNAAICIGGTIGVTGLGFMCATIFWMWTFGVVFCSRQSDTEMLTGVELATKD